MITDTISFHVIGEIWELWEDKIFQVWNNTSFFLGYPKTGLHDIEYLWNIKCSIKLNAILNISV